MCDVMEKTPNEYVTKLQRCVCVCCGLVVASGQGDIDNAR